MYVFKEARKKNTIIAEHSGVLCRPLPPSLLLPTARIKYTYAKICVLLIFFLSFYELRIGNKEHYPELNDFFTFSYEFNFCLYAWCDGGLTVEISSPCVLVRADARRRGPAGARSGRDRGTP